jgi:hypothetical protein
MDEPLIFTFLHVFLRVPSVQPPARPIYLGIEVRLSAVMFRFRLDFLYQSISLPMIVGENDSSIEPSTLHF